MRVVVVVFWISVLAAFLWCGFCFAAAGVAEFYHPMAARGDLFHALRKWSFFGPVFAVLSISWVCLWKRSVPDRVWLSMLGVTFLSALLPFLPRIDNGYKQVYWLADQAYEIPWQSGPYNGQDSPGGTYFLIKVTPQALLPIYAKAENEETVVVGLFTENQIPEGRQPEAEICLIEDYGFVCNWGEAGEFYYASGDLEHQPADPAAFAAEAEELLRGFAKN